MPAAGESVQRLDKWLWFARVTKSRSLAQRLILDGGVRVNGVKAEQSSRPVRVGDVLTINAGRAVRVLRLAGLGVRRGPSEEARGLYEDLSPVPAPLRQSVPQAAERAVGSGRPTKRERRATDRLKGGFPPLGEEFPTDGGRGK